MIIDVHAHVFPPKIAGATLDALSRASGNLPSSDGTLDGLARACTQADVDVAVNMPVLTKPSQFDSANRFAAEINSRFCGRGVTSFAGIHPLCEDVEGKVKEICERGFLGIKIHPDYQGTFIDDDAYYAVLKHAKDRGLVVLTHAGVDMGFPGAPVRCTPERVLALLNRLGGYDRLVLAHLGGSQMADEVIDRLCGQNVMFDTSFDLANVPAEKFKKIVELHGADRILFGTDSPWRAAAELVLRLKGFGLSEEEEGKILGENARRLLNLGEI